MFGIKSVHEDGMFNSSNRSCTYCCNSFHEKRGTWIKIFPDKPITKKPLEVRMGKGKGAVEYWAAVVKPEELCLKLEEFFVSCKEALRLAAQKLPVKN
jgi:large subunit ribosomal protein L16